MTRNRNRKVRSQKTPGGMLGVFSCGRSPYRDFGRVAHGRFVQLNQLLSLTRLGGIGAEIMRYEPEPESKKSENPGWNARGFFTVYVDV
jgi:hypothetical protein